MVGVDGLLAHPVLRSIVRIDRSQISYATAARAAVGVVIPLALGAANGQLLIGLTVSLGALQVGTSDRPGPYGSRITAMLLSALCTALAVFVGSTIGSMNGVAVLIALVWSFGAGLLVAVGPVATQVGLTSIVVLLVFAAQPDSLALSAGKAELVFLGGIFLTVLAVAAWPVQPFAPQRAALAAALRTLATIAHMPIDPLEPPPGTAEFTNARTALSTPGARASVPGRMLRNLLDRAERIRLQILALDDVRRLSSAEHDDVPSHHIDDVLDAASAVLVALADGLANGRPSVNVAGPLRRIEGTVLSLRRTHGIAGRADFARAAQVQMEALADQLRAAVAGTVPDHLPGEQGDDHVEVRHGVLHHLRHYLAVLRDNLTLRSAVCRHALRLAVAIGGADVVARALTLPRAYWVPLTVALVLKPDFASTYSRGLARVAGTALGLGITTLLVYVIFGSVPARIVLLALLMFAMRSWGAANYGLLAAILTALVVVLTSFVGASPEATIVDRGLDTVIGGILALVTYVAWPTWERTQVPQILADLLDAYRRYLLAVIDGYLQTGGFDPGQLDTVRSAARLARASAVASVERLRGEPLRYQREAGYAMDLLSCSHQFAHSAMVLEAGLYCKQITPVSPALRTFAHHVDVSLQGLAHAFHAPQDHLHELHYLDADLSGLGPATPNERRDGDPDTTAAPFYAVVVIEASSIAESISSMIALLLQHADALAPEQMTEAGVSSG